MAERMANCTGKGCPGLVVYTFPHPWLGPASLCLDCLAWSMTESYREVSPVRTMTRRPKKLRDLHDAIVGTLAAHMLAGLLPRDVGDAEVIALIDEVARDRFGIDRPAYIAPERRAFAAEYMREQAKQMADAIEEGVRNGWK